MGQAKQRGTFEQRKAEGIAKRQEEERKVAEALAARRAEQIEREARKTPEERDRDRRAAALLASVLGTVVTSSSAKGLEIARMAAEYSGNYGRDRHCNSGTQRRDHVRPNNGETNGN